MKRLDVGRVVRQTNALGWFGLAIGGIAFGWGATTNPAALVSLWSDESVASLAMLAAAAVVAAVGQRVTRRPRIFAALFGGVVAVAAFGIAAFTAVALILIAAYGLGAWLLDWTQHGETEARHSDVFADTTVGLAVFSLVLGFTAHAAINIPAAYLALCAVSIAAGWRRVVEAWTRFVATARDDRNEASPLLLLIALWFGYGLHVCFAALPERYHDALAMHLVVPRALQLFGYWHFDAREYAWAVQPMAANWLFGYAYVLAGEYAAKLLNAGFLLLTCGVIIETKAVSRRLGLFAAAILALTPLSVIETASAFVDTTLTLFVVAAVIFAARLRDAGASAIVAGFALASAGAIAVKLHGALAFVSALLALLVVGGLREIFRGGRRTTVVCVAAAIAACWPYAYAWYATGNPVFPYFNAIFRSELFAPVNFRNELYPGGVALTDFIELTFRTSKYLEGWDGAAGFALTLLLPAGLLMVAIAGSQKLRVIALAALVYCVILLLNTRYVRYLFPVFPLLTLIVVYPLSVAKGPYLRGAVVLIASIGIGYGLIRIPAAGWILWNFDFAAAFSESAKQALVDNHTPIRKLGRIQAVVGNLDSRVVVFGQSAGADIKGRPLYVSWYYQKLADLAAKTATADAAGAALAALSATHVIFPAGALPPHWLPWHDAAKKYGRLIAQNSGGELYEFRAAEVGTDLFAGAPGPWQRWDVDPRQQNSVMGPNLTLPAAGVTSRLADIRTLPDGAQIALSAEHVCDGRTSIRTQMNWLAPNGTIIRSDAARSACADTPERASLRGAKPTGAEAVYLYFVNDGNAAARLYEERASVLP